MTFRLPILNASNTFNNNYYDDVYIEYDDSNDDENNEIEDISTYENNVNENDINENDLSDLIDDIQMDLNNDIQDFNNITLTDNDDEENSEDEENNNNEQSGSK